MKARSFRDSDTVDFVVVGSGAAGGVIARELARANLSVVVLEQGPRYTPSDFEHDELKYWFMGGITTDPVRNPQSFRHNATQTAERTIVRPALFYARGVGGTTLHYTANYWRFREIDFNERSALGAISGTGFADGPSVMPSLSLTPRLIGKSVSRGWPAHTPSSRRARARIPCRRCR